MNDSIHMHMGTPKHSQNKGTIFVHVSIYAHHHQHHHTQNDVIAFSARKRILCNTFITYLTERRSLLGLYKYLNEDIAFTTSF